MTEIPFHRASIWGLCCVLMLFVATTHCSPTTTTMDGSTGESTSDTIATEQPLQEKPSQERPQPRESQPDAAPPQDRASQDTAPQEQPVVPDGPTPRDDATPEPGPPEPPQERQVTPDGPPPDRGTPSQCGLPIGIPAPSFGLNETHQMYQGKAGYKTSPAGPYTHYVDNTHPSCDDQQSHGTPAKPLCDIFKGQRSITLPAGSVVEIHGGPYKYDGWRRIISQGTAAQPVFVRGHDPNARIRIESTGSGHDLRLQGSYFIIEHLEFYNQSRLRAENEPDHGAFRHLEIHNAPGTTVSYGSALAWTGADVLIYKCHIHHNVRMRSGKVDDLHGITLGAGSRRAWILENHIHHNSGDSFQACHLCRDYPRFVYIGRNTFHEDRENGVDLKTIYDVVVSENTIYGYKNSSTSNGDAVVIGSNGYDGTIGPDRVWFIANTIRDSARGIRVEGAGSAHIIGNFIYNVGDGIAVEKRSHEIVIDHNTIIGTKQGVFHTFQCGIKALSITNNIIASSDQHIALESCLASVAQLSHNLFWRQGGSIKVGIKNGQRPHYTGSDSSALDAFVKARFKGGSGNLIGDPAFVKANDAAIKASSPAVDKGSLSPAFAAFMSRYQLDIRRDLACTRRPAGGQWDIGAFEVP